jgi:hypothetical protein
MMIQPASAKTAPGTMEAINRMVKACNQMKDTLGEVNYLFVGISAIKRDGPRITQIRVDLYEIKSGQIKTANIGNPRTTMDETAIYDIMFPPRIMPLNGIFVEREKFGNVFEPSSTKDLVTQTVAAKLENQTPYALVRPSEQDIFGKIVHRVGIYSGIADSVGAYADYDMKTMIVRVYDEKGKKFDPTKLKLTVDEMYLFIGLRHGHLTPTSGSKPLLTVGGFFDVISVKDAISEGRFTEEQIKQSIAEEQKTSQLVQLQIKRPREEDVTYV